jgi:Phage integrase family
MRRDCVNLPGENKRHCRLERLIGSVVSVQALLSAALGWASEVCSLEWHQIELDQGGLHVRRAKRGTPSVHPIRGDEIRALRRLRRENSEAYVFVSERGGPISPMGFHHLMVRLGNAAEMPFAVHPHILRHACGFKLANDGHDTRALQHYLATRISSTQCAADLRQPISRGFCTQLQAVPPPAFFTRQQSADPGRRQCCGNLAQPNCTTFWSATSLSAAFGGR